MSTNHEEWAAFNVKDIYKDGFVMSRETAIETGNNLGDLVEKYRANGDILFTNIWVPDIIGGMKNGKEEADKGAEAGSKSEGTEEREQAAEEGDKRPEP